MTSFLKSGIKLTIQKFEWITLKNIQKVGTIFFRLTVQLSGLVCLLVGLLLSPLGVQLDEVVDAEDGDCGLRGELEALDLWNRRLENAGLAVVADHAVGQVEAEVSEFGVIRLGLEMLKQLSLIYIFVL